jgi:8-amino-7-oxononanoate synthase
VVNTFMFSAEKTITEALLKREGLGSLRKLSITDKHIDFSSNDYLGFARSPLLKENIEKAMSKLKLSNGSGGSRLLTGNSTYAEELEAFLATIHKAEAALLFNSGYDANVGLLSSVPTRGDTILYDELVHASIHDGMRLSKADSFAFRHNDIEHLHERLKVAKGNIFVVVESVYSMDGDATFMEELEGLYNTYNLNLIVDEAHATGVFEMGLVQKFNVQDKIFARVHTFGKAMGCHGAVVLGSNKLKQYLINYARSFIYTTALPLHSLVSIECAYKLLAISENEAEKLKKNINYFKSQISLENGWMDSNSAIQSLVIPGNEMVKQVAAAIQKEDMDVRPIMSPTVPKGKERIRICLHSYNTKEEIDRLLKVINEELIK